MADSSTPGSPDLSLFREAGEASEPTRAPVGPLAARMRPQRIEEFKGQAHLLGPEKPLGAMIARGVVSSMILWGPPGSGKTTLAVLLAKSTDATFVPFSAVTEGLPRVREIIAQAKERQRLLGRNTILFCDEIHRFNKAQQDAFLPHVEDGTVVLIGATTENPSFEIIRPLLSRAPVFVLEPLGEAALREILDEAVSASAGYGEAVVVEAEALDMIAAVADGDARRALGLLERAVDLAGAEGPVEVATVREVTQHRFANYDKSGEEHFNLISALHKSIRGSDPQGALYWLARMLRAGEDGMYIARRMVRMAAEDIGLADPAAVRIALSARDAYHFLGAPEGELALAEAAIYLATTEKSNRVYQGWKAALAAAADTPSAPVPLHLRNAPTSLMKELGYGKGYRYDPDEPGGVAQQRYLPEEVGGAEFYRPSDAGRERRIAERMKWITERRVEGPPGANPEGSG